MVDASVGFCVNHQNQRQSRLVDIVADTELPPTGPSSCPSCRTFLARCLTKTVNIRHVQSLKHGSPPPHSSPPLALSALLPLPPAAAAATSCFRSCLRLGAGVAAAATAPPLPPVATAAAAARRRRASSQISRLETSAGLTPPMREAWPTSLGLTLSSFSLASKLRV